MTQSNPFDGEQPVLPTHARPVQQARPAQAPAPVQQPQYEPVPAQSHAVVIPTTKLDQWKENRKQASEYLRAKPLALTLDFLLANDLPVYVRNSTGNSSVLLFNMIDNSGRRIGTQVKPAPIPVNMSQKFSPEVINNSPEFIDLLYKQLLVLVAPEQAEAELASPIAQAFLAKNASRVSNASALARTVNPNDGAHQATVSERMRTIVHDVQRGELVGFDAVLKVFGVINAFNASDFNYMYAQLSDEKFVDITTAVRAEVKRRGIAA